MRIRTLAVLCALAAPGALAQDTYEADPGMIYPGGVLIIFSSSQGPLSYEMPSRRELPAGAQDAGEVSGKSCQYGLSSPLGSPLARAPSVSGAEGNGGFDKTLRGIKEQHPDLRGIYDAKVDLHTTSILGIFCRLCTEINARSFR